MSICKNDCLVSYIVSVYNGGDKLVKTIDSIINQSYDKLELIIIDDGSTDNTKKTLRRYESKFKFIKVIYQSKNIGLTKSLNRAANLAKGQFIARLDSGDISLKTRTQKQISYFCDHPDLVLLGTKSLESYGNEFSQYNPPCGPDISKKMYYKNVLVHSSAMFKRDIFELVGGYDETFQTSQDYELWLRMSKHGKVSNLDSTLVVRDYSPASISRVRKTRQLIDSVRARIKHAPLKLLPLIFFFILYQAIVTYSPRFLILFKRSIFKLI